MHNIWFTKKYKIWLTINDGVNGLCYYKICLDIKYV